LLTESEQNKSQSIVGPELLQVGQQYKTREILHTPRQFVKIFSLVQQQYISHTEVDAPFDLMKDDTNWSTLFSS